MYLAFKVAFVTSFNLCNYIFNNITNMIITGIDDMSDSLTGKKDRF